MQGKITGKPNDENDDQTCRERDFHRVGYRSKMYSKCFDSKENVFREHKVQNLISFRLGEKPTVQYTILSTVYGYNSLRLRRTRAIITYPVAGRRRDYLLLETVFRVKRSIKNNRLKWHRRR